ncbi:NADPH:quinone oxidoreductase family protein [Crossiella sp. CA198]|uniref:NADPH:quinone oxidoreductase family protein n=1 Tax=Crossiella sp. CA198 TaxID=3455607 RepID=UPI003F8D240D
MRAWRVHELGEPRDVLKLDEVPDPVAGPGQLLVKVRATALNFPDVLICRGQYQVRPPLPFTPGVELCGDVVALGEGASGWSVGDRVIATPAPPHGGLADYVTVNANEVIPAPESLDDAQAASFHIAYQTGWFGLHRRAGLAEGETLLVHAAAGGVGSAAVQLGKAAGATVIGVVGGARKAEVAKQLGADLVIDRKQEDVIATVKEFTGGRGVDVVYDPVGGESFRASTKVIAFEGRIVIVGFASGEIPSAAMNHALVKNYSLLGLHWGLYTHKDPASVRQASLELAALAEEGLVDPLVGERLPLAEAPAGLQRLADGDSVGRVVVTFD